MTREEQVAALEDVKALHVRARDYGYTPALNMANAKLDAVLAALSAAPSAPRAAVITVTISGHENIAQVVDALRLAGYTVAPLAEAAPPAPTPPGNIRPVPLGCSYHPVQSRICERGTHGCRERHNAAPAPTGAPRKFSELHDKMSPEAQARSRAETARLLSKIDAPTGAPADLVALGHRIREACEADLGPCEPSNQKPLASWCDACLAMHYLRLAWHPAASALPPTRKTCSTCRWLRLPADPEAFGAEAKCCHESEAHPLHWATEVLSPETFGCTEWEPVAALPPVEDK